MYQIEKLPEAPIILGTIDDSFDLRRDMESYLTELHELLDAQSESVFYVNNLKDNFSLNLDDLLVASNEVVRGKHSVLKHPNMRAILLVTHNKMLEIAAKGFNTVLFGFIKITVFHTLDEAIAYCEAS